MARTNMRATRTKPTQAELLVCRVLRTERVSPSFTRVVLGGDDLARFTPLGFDQWFRLFLPVDGGDLAHAPHKLDTVSYVKFLTTSKATRPILRNYTVRAFRRLPGGDELDIDFVMHGDGHGGHDAPTAASWARSANPGDVVGIIDEGIGFDTRMLGHPLLVVADESALPAAAGILGSLPRTVEGAAVLEIPDDADVRAIDAPAGVTVHWVVREHGHAPGSAALSMATGLPSRPEQAVWVAGEQSLPRDVRRHAVQTGIPKEQITFIGYWRVGRSG